MCEIYRTVIYVFSFLIPRYLRRLFICFRDWNCWIIWLLLRPEIPPSDEEIQAKLGLKLEDRPTDWNEWKLDSEPKIDSHSNLRELQRPFCAHGPETLYFRTESIPSSPSSLYPGPTLSRISGPLPASRKNVDWWCWDKSLYGSKYILWVK